MRVNGAVAAEYLCTPPDRVGAIDRDRREGYLVTESR